MSAPKPNSIIQGDCLEVMRAWPAACVHCCVTSPPYWGLRDYGVDGQLGLERTPDEYIANMVKVFREVRRVMRDDGTLWLNIGDSYCASAKGNLNGQDKSGLTSTRTQKNSPVGVDKSRINGMKQKDLVGIPWMLAFALRDNGWYLRQDIIWHKPNPMPESVRDRCSNSHEYIFLLTKSEKYFYDQFSILEPVAESSRERLAQDVENQNGSSRAHGAKKQCMKAISREGGVEQRNKRSVWTVATRPNKSAHFAVFPPALIEPCILAGSPEECCSSCGTPYKRILKRTRVATRPGLDTKTADRDPLEIGNRDPQRHVTKVQHLRFDPCCRCDAGKTSGTVLDPFSGSGTTAQVAQKNGRHYVGCELNPEYLPLSTARTAQRWMI